MTSFSFFTTPPSEFLTSPATSTWTYTVTSDPKDAYEKPLVEGEVPPSVEEPTDVDLEDDAPDPVEE